MQLTYYFFWAATTQCILYIVYQLILKRETFFSLNRFYLLASLFFSLLMPSIDFPAGQYLAAISAPIPEINIIGRMSTNLTTDKTTNWLLIIYCVGTGFSLFLFLIRISQLKNQLARPVMGQAFSFWNRIVIDPALDRMEVIRCHETIHTRQKHSADLLFIEILKIFFWFNPMLLLYRRSLKITHEYIADEKAAVVAGSNKKYAAILFYQNFQVSPLLSNSFFAAVPGLKVRISMLQQKRSGRLARLKLLVAVPVILMISFVSCMSNNPGSNKGKAADRAAGFEGGYTAFKNYVINHANSIVSKNARVVVGFTVEADGQITNKKIIEGGSEDLNQHVMQLLHQSPRWQPAIMNGEPVKSANQVAINFSKTENFSFDN